MNEAEVKRGLAGEPDSIDLGGDQPLKLYRPEIGGVPFYSAPSGLQHDGPEWLTPEYCARAESLWRQILPFFWTDYRRD